MPEAAHGYLEALLANLRVIRKRAGLSEAQLEERLILGPGWVRRFEGGETVPTIDMLLAILHETGAGLSELLKGLPEPEAATVERAIFAEQIRKDITVYFRYADYDAQYTLPNATLDQFETVLKTLRDGLARLAGTRQDESDEAKAIKTDSVARTFLKAMALWPKANPSDVWWFIVYRAYCDPYNHPAQFARLDLTQSWKRTGGWALEEILVRHYGPFLKKNGINLHIVDKPTIRKMITALKLADRIEADKIDVVLTGETQRGPQFFGVVHVKASFAERRTDDVPMSMVLTRAGYTSPLWTMDCKSMPGPNPFNRGELGSASGKRSAKRMDIEDEGFFTGCFSYNSHTQQSPASLPAARRIYQCNFADPDDTFSRFIITRWRAFQSSAAKGRR